MFGCFLDAYYQMLVVIATDIVKCPWVIETAKSSPVSGDIHHSSATECLLSCPGSIRVFKSLDCLSTTQAENQAHEVTHSNIYLLYELLEHVKRMNLHQDPDDTG